MAALAQHSGDAAGAGGMHAHAAWASAQPSPAERSQPAGKRRPRPFTAAFIVLLGTILATALAQRWLYAALDLAHSSQCSAAQTDAADVLDKAVPFTTDEWDPPGCTPPQLRAENMAAHGCELWNDMCMDQGRLISWAAERMPGASNFSDRVLLAARPLDTLPGYPADLQGAQYEVRDPVMRPAALLGGAEQPDVELRRFSDCTLPLVWWPKPAADASGSFVSTLTWLHAAAAGDAPLLVDRKLKLVPDLDGFALPNHLHWLLLPFSKRTVQELHDFSARRPAAPPGRRCFRRVVLCGAGGSKSTWAEEARAAGEPPPLSLDVFATATRRPFEAGQWVAGFYKRAYPAAARPPQPPGSLRVLLATAQLVNPDETLEACRKWTPPGASVPAACEGTDFADGGMPGDIAALRRADVLVGTPAAPLAYGLMMRRGSTVLQLRPPGAPQGTLERAFEAEGAVKLVMLTPGSGKWQPSALEVRQKELDRAGSWPSEQRLRLDWGSVAVALEATLGSAKAGS